MQLIDSHCHLGFADFGEDREAVLERARAAGCVALITVGAGAELQSAIEAVTLAESHDDLYAAVCIHPHDVARMPADAVRQIEGLLCHPRVVALGETGLDYYYRHSPPDRQQRAFRDFVALARATAKPLSVHVRDAHDDARRILLEEHASEVGGVIHCFSGTLADAQAYVAAGFHLSFSGVLTFKNAAALRQTAAWVPAERLLVETDAPYLAPLPHRGRRNEPAWVVETARALAAAQGVSLEDIARITTRNARSLFRLPLAEDGGRQPVIAYTIRDSLYLNVTNRCTLACRFCGKRADFVVRGHHLELRCEPTLEEIRAAMLAARPAGHQEVVFCGYGEPTLRLAEVKQLAAELRAAGHCTRLNTDGLASLVHGHDVTPELAGLFDVISVSLNAPDAASYAHHCPSKYGEAAYPAVKQFITAARKHVPKVIATVVALPNLDLDACRQVAEDELGVELRVREYNRLG